MGLFFRWTEIILLVIFLANISCTGFWKDPVFILQISNKIPKNEMCRFCVGNHTKIQCCNSGSFYLKRYDNTSVFKILNKRSFCHKVVSSAMLQKGNRKPSNRLNFIDKDRWYFLVASSDSDDVLMTLQNHFG